MNVTSLFVMMGGGLAWAFDVGSLEELRGRVGMRKIVAERELDGSGGGKSEDDREMEGLVARALGRKVEQGRKGGEGNELEKREEEADEVREG
jgi:hypothetical protein